MSTASISRSAVATAIILLAVAGCDSSVPSERSSATQAGTHGLRPVEWYEARANVLRARLDSERGRIWTLHADGVDLYDARSDQKLRSFALPEWIWAGPFSACPPDLALGGGGEVVVSSNVVPVLWRIDPASFQVSRHELTVVGHPGREVGFSGLLHSPRQGVFLGVNGPDGSMWRIDASLTRAEHIPLSSPMPRACGLSAKSGGAGKPGLGALCVQAEEDEWTVHFAPDHRTGYVHPSACSAREIAPSAQLQTSKATF